VEHQARIQGTALGRLLRFTSVNPRAIGRESHYKTGQKGHGSSIRLPRNFPLFEVTRVLVQLSVSFRVEMSVNLGSIETNDLQSA
jgi:hypothetical protein